MLRPRWHGGATNAVRPPRANGDPGRPDNPSEWPLGSRLRGNERGGWIRSRTLAIVASPSPRHRAIGPDAHIIVAHRCFRRNKAGTEITLDQLQRALGGRPVAAATTGLDADEIACR